MILDWIFEGIVNWVSSIVTKLMDAVSGLFLGALGTNMTAMEEYFPFVARAFTIMQYTAWVILFLITVWQLFRAFGGNLNESESPGPLVLRSALFAFLIYYAKPIFLYILKIATAPYTALMDVTMGSEHFTFAGIEKTNEIQGINFNDAQGKFCCSYVGYNYQEIKEYNRSDCERKQKAELSSSEKTGQEVEYDEYGVPKNNQNSQSHNNNGYNGGIKRS